MYGQTSPPPNAFKYQAVVRDYRGEPQGWYQCIVSGYDKGEFLYRYTGIPGDV